MSTTTDGNHTGPPWKWILGISLGIQVLLFALIWTVEPLRKNTLVFNPDVLQERALEVEERARQREEQEEEQRAKRMLPEESVERLVRQEEEKRKRELKPKLEETRELHRELTEKREEVLEEFEARSMQEVNLRHAHRLVQQARAVQNAGRILMERCPLPIGDELFERNNALLADTEAYVDLLTESGGAALRNTALGVQRDTEAAMKQAEPLPDNGRETHGLLVYDSRALLRELRAYLDLLEDLVFQEEELLALNKTGTAPPPDELPEPPLEEIGLEDLVSEIEARQQAMTDEFAVIRAAEIARMENSSFEEAYGNLVPAVQEAGDGETAAGPAPQNQGEGHSQSGQGGEVGAREIPADTAGGAPAASDQGGGGGASPQGLPGGPSAQGGGGMPMPQTVGELNALRGRMDQQVSAATRQVIQARNIATQAGVSRGTDGTGSSRSPSAFQGAGAGSSRTATDGGGRGGRGLEGGGELEAELPFRGLLEEGPRRVRVSPDLIKARALPGRRFLEQSDRQGWLFVDSWYIIGPWENEGQLDYENVHPPELMIDLEAEYANGKIEEDSGQPYPLRWQFVQSDSMRVVPPQEDTNSTYYAYSEIWVDRDRDLMLAIASDDAARVWVNRELVWEDSGLSGWSLDEGFRRVRFREGFNTLLVRLENGIVITEFSLLLCPPEQVE